MAVVYGAQHALDRLAGKIAGAISNGLIGQRQCIAHGTRSGLRQQTQGGRFKRDAFLAQNFFQLPDDGFCSHLLKRSAERRVGKEWVRKLRYPWSPHHKKKKYNTLYQNSESKYINY